MGIHRIEEDIEHVYPHVLFSGGESSGTFCQRDYIYAWVYGHTRGNNASYRGTNNSLPFLGGKAGKCFMNAAPNFVCAPCFLLSVDRRVFLSVCIFTGRDNEDFRSV